MKALVVYRAYSSTVSCQDTSNIQKKALVNEATYGLSGMEIIFFLREVSQWKCLFLMVKQLLRSGIIHMQTPTVIHRHSYHL